MCSENAVQLFIVPTTLCVNIASSPTIRAAHRKCAMQLVGTLSCFPAYLPAMQTCDLAQTNK